MKIEELTDYLILNATHKKNAGLWYGKTGIAVFFFHYARHTANDLFKEYAACLMAEVQRDIFAGMLIDYDRGISGIGVAMEYFIQNGFLEPEHNNIFDDFDDCMYHAAIHLPYPGLTLASGLSGWGRYFIYRLKGIVPKNIIKNRKALFRILRVIERKILKTGLSETEQLDIYCFLHDLHDLPDFVNISKNLLPLCKTWNVISQPDVQNLFLYLENYGVRNLARFHFCQKYFGFNVDDEIAGLLEKIRNQKPDESDIQHYKGIYDMGLLNGLAGDGLCRLVTIEPPNTAWLTLL